MQLERIFLITLLIIVYISDHVSNCVKGQSAIGNVTNLNGFSNGNIKMNVEKNSNVSEIAKLANLYDFTLTNVVSNNNKAVTVVNNKTDLQNFSLENIPSAKTNVNKSPPLEKNITKTSILEKFSEKNRKIQATSTLADISELYFFSSSTVLGMSNCSYDNTINISNYAALPNGSYVYDDNTIIPPDLVGNYNYKILYDGSKRSVPMHKRACICRLKSCITLCSPNIIEFYKDLENDDEAEDDFKDLFMIAVTLSNKTVVTRNIANDFEHIVLDEFCEKFYRLSPETNENRNWTLFENGTLLRHSDHAYLKKSEYCFELYQDKIGGEIYYLINPLNCAKQREELKIIQKFHYWSLVLSLPFLLLTIIAYFCLPELRNVHGKCFMTYLSCLTISYSLLSYINLSQNTFDAVPCLFMGYLNHYMQLSQYTWLGIICFDTWKSFSDYTYEASYHKYAMYGLHFPLLITFLTFVAQNSPINNNLRPGISAYRCGLDVNKWQAALYLYGPCLIILICCFISFILISRIIKAHDRQVLQIKERQSECPQSRYTLYIRLFLMMGLSWFLDVLSYFLNMFNMTIFSEVIDYINVLQGLCIFLNFIGRKRIRNIIKKRFY